MRARLITTNFTAGLLSPRMLGRVDHSRYFNGCQTLENMLVWPQGPAQRRSGTRFVAAANYQDRPCRLLTFEYSAEQAYIIEAGHRYFRFYKDGSRIETGGVPVAVAASFAADELAGLRTAQSNDVMYIVNPAQAPKKLLRYSHTSWAYQEVNKIGGPFLGENADDIKTLTPSALSGEGVTVTAAGHAPFAATDLTRLIRIKHGATWGCAVITAVLSTTQVRVSVQQAFGGTTASAAWQLGLYSDTTGWPSAIVFHEERLILAGNATRPQRIDASRSNDFENWTPGTGDADAWGYNIGSDSVVAIRWLASWRNMIVGTIGGEFRVSTGGGTGGITPTNVLIRPETRYRCANLPPLATSDALLFTQRRGGAGNAGHTIREWTYQLADDGYKGDDLTLLADHVTLPGIVDWAYVQDPIPSIWCVLADGTMAACTYWRDQQVIAWHQHTISGGFVESIAAMPGATHDEIWLAVRRTIGGTTRRYIEQLQPPFGDDAELSDAWYVDSGLSWDGAPATVFSGLDHLEGETVAILADGAPVPSQRVVGGTITLPRPARKVIAGLPYQSRLQTMPLDLQVADGTSQGRRANVGEATVRLYRSLGCTVGSSFDGGEEVPFRRGADRMDQPPPLFSGDKQLRIGSDWERRSVCVEQTQPLPLTVLAIMSRLTVND